jgi:hypothetical protein
MPNNQLKWTMKKDGIFQTKKTGRRHNPQPENVIILRRYYSTLKRDKSYKKRVTTLKIINKKFLGVTLIWTFFSHVGAIFLKQPIYSCDIFVACRQTSLHVFYTTCLSSR